MKVTEITGKYGIRKSFKLRAYPLQDSPIESVPDVIETQKNQPVTSDLTELASSVDSLPTGVIPQFSDAIAVIFGIEEYLSAPSAVFAARDATIFYEYAKSVLGMSEQNIYLATNELANRATFKEVFGEAGWLSRRVKPEITEIFIFFSGHGVPTTDNSAYLVLHDVNPNNAQTTGIALTQIYKSLHQLRARHVTIFIDACFSGVARFVNSDADLPVLLADSQPTDALVENELEYKNFTVMTASTGKQVSLGYPDQRHGLFTFYLLMGLKGEADANSNRAVTVNELMVYLKSQIPVKASDLFDQQQTPTVKTNFPERVLVRFE